MADVVERLSHTLSSQSRCRVALAAQTCAYPDCASSARRGSGGRVGRQVRPRPVHWRAGQPQVLEGRCKTAEGVATAPFLVFTHSGRDTGACPVEPEHGDLTPQGAGAATSAYLGSAR